MIKLNGGIVVNLGIAKDNEEEIFKKLSVRKDLDFIVSTAGASKGNYDFIRKILEKKGEIYFSSISSNTLFSCGVSCFNNHFLTIVFISCNEYFDANR